jgi:outer membrane protein assembly factor BamB
LLSGAVGLATTGGSVFGQDYNGTLYRIGQACASDGSTCTAAPVGQAPSSSPGAPGNVAPTVAANVVYAVVANGLLSAYAPDCTPATRGCAPLWQTTDPDGGFFDSTPIVSDGTLYVSGLARNGTGANRLYAFTLGGVAAGTTP